MKQVQVIRATKHLDEEDVIRVGAYCRVSTDHEDQINSFLAQMQYYSEYIRENERMKLVQIPFKRKAVYSRRRTYCNRCRLLSY